MSLKTLLAINATRDFLQDGDVYDALVEVGKKYHIPEERINELLDLTDAVLDEQLPLADIPAMLSEAFGTDESTSRALASEIAGVRLLPLEVFLPGTGEQITAWGGEVAAFGSFRVQKEGVQAEDLAKTVAERAGLSFSELLIKRLAFLLEQRINEQKTNEQLRTFFGRPLTIGGMGLAKEQIDALMDAVTTAVVGVRIIGEEEQMKTDENVETPFMASPSSEPQDKNAKTNTIEKTEVPTMTLEILPSHEVAAEVPVISSPERHVEPTVVQAAVPAVAVPQVKKIGEQPMVESPDPQSKKRAEKAQKMEAEAMKVAWSEAIEYALQKTQTVRDTAKIPQAAFADIAGKMLRGIRDQYQTRDVLERDYGVKGDTLSTLMEALRNAEDAYRIAGDTLMQAEGKHEQPSEENAATREKQEAMQGDTKFSELTKNASKPQPAEVALTVGSVATVPNEHTQKRVADVVAGNRLMGPVEQLGTMTLADFRRLSTNPDEAVRKMEALLLALQKGSYEDRVQGVLAWRKSPLASLSVALTTESLNTGVAIAEIAARRRSQGQESLGPAEMHALSKWNEKIRF